MIFGISTSYIGPEAVAACADVKKACCSEDLGDAIGQCGVVVTE